MKLLFKFQSPKELLHKIERDKKRVFNALQNKKTTEICDSFFDFVLTAHSLRDWLRKYKKVTKKEINDICDNYSELEVCRDIANANKHFGLNQDSEKIKKTFSVFVGSSPMFEIYENDLGKLLRVKKDYPDILIINENGSIMGLWEFMENVTKSWNQIFKGYAVS